MTFCEKNETILDTILSLLPTNLQTRITALIDHPKSPQTEKTLIELVLDFGFVPSLRFQDGEEMLLEDQGIIDRAFLDTLCEHLPDFGADNRSGFDGTLHRISALRNRLGEIIGLTIRIGRAFEGSLNALTHQLELGNNLLFIGPPGLGKTTKLREAARLLSTQYKKRVLIVDTSNEIAGPGNIPHPCIGRARRLQVSCPKHQGDIMIEAVENHMPEVIIVDEIGSADKVAAALTIAQRGVQLIATAHATSLASLVKNPMLNDLTGGIAPVILGDEEARLRGSQKTVLERQFSPPFDSIVELKSENSCLLYNPLENHVDALLRDLPIDPIIIQNIKKSPSKYSQHLSIQEQDPSDTSFYLFGLNQTSIQNSMDQLNLPACIAPNIGCADLILTTKQALKNNNKLAQMLRGRQLPVHSISSANPTAIEKFFTHFFGVEAPKDALDCDKILEDTKLACEKVIKHHEIIELRAQNAYLRKKQHEEVQKLGLVSLSIGKEPNRRIRILPK